MAMRHSLFLIAYENLLAHSSHCVLVSRGFSIWFVFAKLGV